MSSALLLAAAQHGFAAVQAASVATTITISGPTSVAQGSQIQLTATVLDQYGAAMAGQPVTWSSGSANASVSSTGLVTGGTVGTATITATSGSASASTDVTVTAAASPLTAGTSTATPGDGSVALSATAPTGGTAPYTYQWHRSTTTGFTPGAGTAIGGATGLTYTDGGRTNGTPYYYKLVATDAAAASVTYAQVSATPAATTITFVPTVYPSSLIMPNSGVARIQVDLGRKEDSTNQLQPFVRGQPYEDMSLHTVSFSSSNEAVATVALDPIGVMDRSLGLLLTPHGPGTATITVVYDGGAYTKSMSVTVNATVPGAVAGLTPGTASGMSLPLTWSAWTDVDGDFDHFRAYYTTDGTDPTTASRCVMVSRGSAAATSGTARAGKPNTLHRIALAAVDKAGNIGALSNVVSMTSGAREASNEPAGYSLIFYNDGTTSLPGVTPDDYLAIVADEDAVNGSAVEFRWWNDERDGNGKWDDKPGGKHTYSHLDNGPLGSIASEVYFRLVMRHNIDWIHQIGGDKLSYFGQDTLNSAMFPVLYTPGSPPSAPYGLGFQNQCTLFGSFRFTSLAGNARPLYMGAYHTYEFQIIQQSGATDPGTGEYLADGTLRIWIDGVKWIEKTDVQWVKSGVRGFQRFEWGPYWGGGDYDGSGTASTPWMRYYKHTAGPFLPVGAYDWVRFAEFYESGKV